MKNHLCAAKKPLMVMGLMSVTVLLAQGAQAQKQPSNKARTDPPPSVLDVGIRDMQVRSLELSKEDKGDTTPTAAPEVVKQVREDFGRIQEINAEVMQGYASGAAPDYKHLSEAMAEINKRASRLNTYLLLPQLSVSEPLQEQDGSPLVQLNGLILSFVTNPIFKNANTIDAKDGTKARRDLQSIVDLSNRIRKSAEKLDKSGGKVK